MCQGEEVNTMIYLFTYLFVYVLLFMSGRRQTISQGQQPDLQRQSKLPRQNLHQQNAKITKQSLKGDS